MNSWFNLPFFRNQMIIAVLFGVHDNLTKYIYDSFIQIIHKYTYYWLKAGLKSLTDALWECHLFKHSNISRQFCLFKLQCLTSLYITFLQRQLSESTFLRLRLRGFYPHAGPSRKIPLGCYSAECTRPQN